MTPLAPDPAVPRRDALLRPATMAGVLSQRLHGGVPVERPERMHVKYRVGESLRVVYRYVVGGEVAYAAARSGRSGAAGAAGAAEAAYAPARSGRSGGVSAPEVGA